MRTIAQNIRDIVHKLQSETSKSDPHHEQLRDISDLCDELIDHHTPDGR